MRILPVVFLIACTGRLPGDSGDDPEDTDTDSASTADSLIVVGFNCESGGSDPNTVAETIAARSGEDMWGFVEVEDEAAARIYVDAADDGDQSWDHVTGTTGYEDLMVLAWDDARVELLDSEELDWINVSDTVRAPLVGHMRDRENDTEFLFVVNHLFRTDDDARHEQAELLNAWGADQDLPIVMVGDYNFDWAVPGGEDDHDEGFDLLTDNDVFEWVEPEEQVPTQCSFYDSILDFVFVGGDARDWDASSKILEPQNGYCTDEDNKSDHRPVSGTIGVE